MNFSTPGKVLSYLLTGDLIERQRASNRAKINDAANCFPMPDDDAKKIGLKVNVNFGEMMELMAEARRQYRTAFRFDQHFFKVGIPLAPEEYRTEWEMVITDAIAKEMRESVKYFELGESESAAVVCHGIGPLWYRNPDSWCPEFVSIADLRIPTDTTTDFDNLDAFGIMRRYTVSGLLEDVIERDPHKRWNRDAIKAILLRYKEQNQTSVVNNYNWYTDIEKLHTLLKQNGDMFSNDALPAIQLWHFFFKEDNQWSMRIVPATGAVQGAPEQDKFLWTSDQPCAEKLEHFLHVAYGDLNNDAPFKYHAVRSLGFALLEPCFYSNLTTCRFLQHVLDQFNIWLKSNEPSDRARGLFQTFQNLAVLKPGIGIVPRDERHQIDAQLVEMASARMSQLQQRASSTYTQQADTGTRKEQTAFETSVKVQQVNAMTSGLLTKAFVYKGQEYREIARRFCKNNSSDEAVKRVQKKCQRAGIPSAFMDVDKWEVEAVTPLGMGNPTVAMAMAKQLFEMKGAYEPMAQQEILHEVTAIITQDWRKARRWAPINRTKGITDGQDDSAKIFPLLMLGIPRPPREGVGVIDQIEGMLPLLHAKITMIEQRDNMATIDEEVGLKAVIDYTQQLISRLAQNPQEGQRVKQYGDALGQLTNRAKGVAQRGEQARQKESQQAQGPQGNPEAAAKIQSTMMTAAANIQAKRAAHDMKLKQSEQKFILDQRREDAKTYHQMEREALAADARNEQTAAAVEPKE